MFIDALGQFASSAGEFAPTSTGDNYAANVIDTGPLGGSPTPNGGRNVGEGEDLYLIITVLTTVTSAGSATVNFELVTSASSSLTSPVVLASTGAIAKASLVAGAQFKIKFPNSSAYLEFLGLDANIGTAALTAGAFSAQIAKDVGSDTQYAGNYTVS